MLPNYKDSDFGEIDRKLGENYISFGMREMGWFGVARGLDMKNRDQGTKGTRAQVNERAAGRS